MKTSHKKLIKAWKPACRFVGPSGPCSKRVVTAERLFGKPVPLCPRHRTVLGRVRVFLK